MIFNIFACTTVATGFAYCIFYLIAYRLSHFVSAFLILPYFVLAEKPLRLMACRVAITISAMCGLFCFLRKIEGWVLGKAFFCFGLLGRPTRRIWDAIYTPLPAPSKLRICKQYQAVMQEYQFRTYVSIRQIRVCSINLLRFLYRMHNSNHHICTHSTIYANSVIFRPVCPPLMYISVFIVPVFPSLEAPAPPCVDLRSVVLSAAECPVAVLPALVPSLPCRKQLLRRISDSHSFRSGY